MYDDLTGLVVAAVIIAIIVFILVVSVSCYCWRRIENKRQGTKKGKTRSSSMITSSTALGHPPYPRPPYCVPPSSYQYPAVPPAMHLATYQPQYIPVYKLPGLAAADDDVRVSPRSTDFAFTDALYISHQNGDVPRDHDRWYYDRPKPRKHPEWIKKSYEETGKTLNIGDDEKSKHSSVHSIKIPSNVEDTTQNLDEFTIVDYVTTNDAPSVPPVFKTVITQRDSSPVHISQTSPEKSPRAPPSPALPDPTPVASTSMSTRQEVVISSLVPEVVEKKDMETETEEYLLSYRQRKPREGDTEFIPPSGTEPDPVTSQNETNFRSSYKPDPNLGDGIPEGEIQQEYVARVTSYGMYDDRGEEHHHHQQHHHHHHQHHHNGKDDNEHHVDYRVIRKSGRKPSWLESTGSWFKRGKKNSSKK